MLRMLPAVVLFGALAAFFALQVLGGDEGSPPAGRPGVAALSTGNEPSPVEGDLQPEEGSAGEVELSSIVEQEASAEAPSIDDAILAEESAEPVSSVVNAGAEASAEEPSLPDIDPGSVQNFDDLNAAIEELARRHDGRISVAILSEQGMVFNSDPSGTYGLASVAKLYLLAGYLDFLAQQGRMPDESESFLLQAMIGRSDNASAEAIWQALGGTEAMHTYLESRGFFGLVPAEDGSWGGASTTTADTALFLSRLTSGDLLDEERTAYILTLLTMVEASQRWGVTAGVSDADPGAAVLLKDGWYPEWEGWRLNSAGLVVPANGTAAYTIVIFADHIQDFDEGVELVESVARLANALMLRPQAALEGVP